MRSHKETYIKYEEKRDALFVFGAGASIAEGAPLQRDILKLIYESDDEQLNKSEAALQVRNFINENFDTLSVSEKGWGMSTRLHELLRLKST